MGCRQVVRLRTLTPPFVGSNPATPVLKTWKNVKTEKVIFSLHSLHNLSKIKSLLFESGYSYGS